MIEQTPVLPGLPPGGGGLIEQTPLILPNSRAIPRGLGGLLTEGYFTLTDEELDEAAVSTVHGAEPDDAWDEFTVDMMRASCAFFAQEILTGAPEHPYNGRFMISDHHQEWDELIAENDRLCVLAPRDHGKTFFFDFAYPIWKAYFNPRTKGFIFSATQPLAERILDDIKAELESNPKLQWLVPDKPEMWTKKEIRLTNGVTIYARSFGTRVRGAHPHWIVVDDGLTDETAYSDIVRRKQIDYFYTAITNMIVPGGRIIVVGTPFHMADLYADLEENDEYTFRKYQALDEKNMVALWPERYPVKALLRRKREIRTIRFDREFQCVPISDEMSLFPGYLFKGDPVEQYMVTLGMDWDFWKDKLQFTVMGCDFAISAEQGADFSVFWVQGVDLYGNRWILDIERHKGLPYHQQLSHMHRLAKKYEVGLLLIEANQMQKIFGQELKRKTDLPVQEFVTGVQKHALDKGVPSLRILLENQKFRIPRGDRRSVEITDIWINEMRQCTIIDGKVVSVGAHNDTIMAAWIADQAIRLGTFSYTFGEESDVMSEGQLNEQLGIPQDDLGMSEEISEIVANDPSLKLTPSQRERLGLDPIQTASDSGPQMAQASGNLIDDEFTGLFG